MANLRKYSESDDVMMIEQCKGKDLGKISNRFLDDKTLYYCSIKYDGNYVQIHKKGKEVRFFTSGGKEFYLEHIANYLAANNTKDFILECEYIADTDGSLGSRGRCTTTTFRTNFAKGLSNRAIKRAHFKVFDMICEELPFEQRWYELGTLNLGPDLTRPTFHYITLAQAKTYGAKVTNRGWEGVFLKCANHMQRPGKRVNDAIKLKPRLTADLLCIDVEDGEGKYDGMVGSLVLQDSENRIVRVGSGLDDSDRSRAYNDFVGEVIEIGYEQILDTYIQPTYIRIRHDKSIGEID